MPPQVVWKSSLTLGCAYASCGASFIIANGVFVVCRYSPAGNYLGQFAQNVFPPTATPAPTPAPCSAAGGAGAASAAAAAPATMQPLIGAGMTSAVAPAATAAPSAACPGAAPDPFGDTLGKHNAYRATHQVGFLSWDATLAAAANTWAAQCSFAHDPNNQAGENIYASSAFAITSASVSKAVDAWYSEEAAYNFSKPGYQSGTGHFTQVCFPSR